MTNVLLTAAAAALFALPTVAAAQALPTPVVAVVDVQKADDHLHRLQDRAWPA